MVSTLPNSELSGWPLKLTLVLPVTGAPKTFCSGRLARSISAFSLGAQAVNRNVSGPLARRRGEEFDRMRYATRGF